MRDDELTAAIREVRERVLARNGASKTAPPDLMPLVRARDAAEAKVASIGIVNPRPPGVTNALIQSVKRGIARVLGWHVREQVEFNRGVMGCVQATLEALRETNRVLAALIESTSGASRDIHTLRAIAELQAAFQHRAAQLEQDFRELARRQHLDFTAVLDRRIDEIRAESQRLIHTELRLIRQRSALEPVAAAATAPTAVSSALDWMRFAEQFRGPEENIREHQKRYVSRFLGAPCVLDLGCGRGEFLEAAREAGVPASGVDQSAECVARCRSKGLAAEQSDLSAYLDALPDGSLDGVFCSQVVEHLDPTVLPLLVNLLGRKMRSAAPIVMETPNPESLAIFSTHFYLDPTHTHPVPAALLRFYLEEAGFGGMEIEYMGGDALDYAVFARKL